MAEKGCGVWGQGLAQSLGAFLGCVFARRETAQALGPYPTPFSAILGPFWAILGLFWAKEYMDKRLPVAISTTEQNPEVRELAKKGPQVRQMSKTGASSEVPLPVAT